MKDFDIAKYLREHQLGSYAILNHYVDVKPLKEYSQEEWDGEYTDDMKMNYEDSQNPSEDFKTAAEKALNSYDREEEKLFQSAAYQQLEAEFPKEIAKIEKLASDESGDYADRWDSRRAVIEDYLEGKLDLSSMNENAYEGPEHKLAGDGTEFEQAETVSEQMPGDDTRMMDLGGNLIEQGIIRLMDDGFEAEEILELCQMLVNDQYGAKAQGTPY